jgi:hypothetical protein
VDQLDPIRVDDPEHRRSGQEGLRPGLMGLEETKKETIASLPGFGMAPEEPLLYSWGPNIGTRRATPCLVRVRIDLILAKG